MTWLDEFLNPSEQLGINRWSRAISLVYLSLKRPLLLPRVRRYTLETVDGLHLVVWPDILNPVVFRSGEFLARSLGKLAADEPLAHQTLKVLDMGTGSGIGGMFAARLGYRVIGVDLNPEAVRCARINVLLNHLENEMTVQQGDLFDSVTGEQFDLVLFNPPFFRGEPRSLFDLAWRSTDVFERFAAGLPAALSPSGQALILLSTDGEAEVMLSALEANGLQAVPARRRNFGNEVMTIYRVQRESR